MKIKNLEKVYYFFLTILFKTTPLKIQIDLIKKCQFISFIGDYREMKKNHTSHGGLPEDKEEYNQAEQKGYLIKWNKREEMKLCN